MTAEQRAGAEHGGPADEVPGVERLLALSDGVVAIALTLLVLQLRVPAVSDLHQGSSASELAAQLGKDSPQFSSYLISFYVIAQFWLAHHRVFRQIAGQRESLAWWNFAFLFTITVMPFTSDLLGKFANNPLAVSIFAVNLLAASLATTATLALGRRKKLLRPGVTEQELRAARIRVSASFVVIGASIALAWISTSAAMYCWLLLALAPWAANRIEARHRRDQPGSSR